LISNAAKSLEGTLPAMRLTLLYVVDWGEAVERKAQNKIGTGKETHDATAEKGLSHSLLDIFPDQSLER